MKIKKLLKMILVCLSVMVPSMAAWAQSVKQLAPPPAPHTEEVGERVAMPTTDQTEAVSHEDLILKQQKEQQELEQQKVQEAAIAKERELEKATKVINPNWRNQKSQEQLIMDVKRAEVEAINKADKEIRMAEIKKIEAMLLQVTDEGIKLKLTNKINNLRNHPNETGLAE